MATIFNQKRGYLKGKIKKSEILLLQTGQGFIAITYVVGKGDFRIKHAGTANYRDIRIAKRQKQITIIRNAYYEGF